LHTYNNNKKANPNEYMRLVNKTLSHDVVLKMFKLNIVRHNTNIIG